MKMLQKHNGDMREMLSQASLSPPCATVEPQRQTQRGKWDESSNAPLATFSEAP